MKIKNAWRDLHLPSSIYDRRDAFFAQQNYWYQSIVSLLSVLVDYFSQELVVLRTGTENRPSN